MDDRHCHRSWGDCLPPPPGLSAAHTPYPIGHWRSEGDTQLPTTGARPGTATGLLGGSSSSRVCRSRCGRALVCTVSPAQLRLTTAACAVCPDGRRHAHAITRHTLGNRNAQSIPTFTPRFVPALRPSAPALPRARPGAGAGRRTGGAIA